MFFTLLGQNRSKISQKSQIGLVQIPSIAGSGNSILLRSKQIIKTELQDLTIYESNLTVLENV